MKNGTFLSIHIQDTCNWPLTKNHHMYVAKKEGHIILYDIWMVATVIPKPDISPYGLSYIAIKGSNDQGMSYNKLL